MHHLDGNVDDAGDVLAVRERPEADLGRITRCDGTWQDDRKSGNQ
jgi:hypothetical protein